MTTTTTRSSSKLRGPLSNDTLSEGRGGAQLGRTISSTLAAAAAASTHDTPNDALENTSGDGTLKGADHEPRSMGPASSVQPIDAGPSSSTTPPASSSTAALTNFTTANTLSSVPLKPTSPRSFTEPLLRAFTSTNEGHRSASSSTSRDRIRNRPSPHRAVPPSTSNKNDLDEGGEQRREEGGRLVLDKYTVWETNLKIYIIACNQSDSRYRVLKIDRSIQTPSSMSSSNHSPNPNSNSNSNEATDHHEEKYQEKQNVVEDLGLSITEDDTIYSRDEIELLKQTLSAGNAGGLRKVEGLFYGIIGFIRFTGPYYMILIKRRQHVALIGGHYIYHCEETMLRPISLSGVATKNADEARRLNAFQGVDLSKNFYFSYTYDVTHTLQYNLTRSGSKDAFAKSSDPLAMFNDKWVWNRFLLKPAFPHLKEKSPWILPLIHGFVDQAKLSIFGRTVYITLIARRSRYFAGARFLKRGVNDQGYVANDVETEQIVSDALTTPFHSPAPASHQHPSTGETHQNRKPNPRFTSFVQVRGSIPLFWSQESINMSPKPPIELTIVDPYFSAAALHFDDLLGRYGGPITVLNLIKQKERAPRESKLLPEFKQCIDYLNQFLPDEHKIEYIAWDLAAANKKRDKDVIGILEDIAEESLERNKFFHSGPEPTWFAIHPDSSHPGTYRSTPLLQSGVVRTNCIDCLDRTNAAQFVIAKAALGHQLHALGIIDYPNIPFESDAVNMVMEMFHDHGDTVALQYGGSHLVNTMETYRGIAQWTSHSRDIVNNLRRYYTNSFVDADKQVAIDVFLGIEAPASPLPTVLYSQSKTRRSYRDWYTPDHLKAQLTPKEASERLLATVEQDDASGSANYWQAFYRPQLLTQFDKHFAIIMNSTSKYPKAVWSQDGPDASPFVARHSAHVPPQRTKSSSQSRSYTGARGAGVGYARPQSSLRNRIQAQRIDEGSSTSGTVRSRSTLPIASIVTPASSTPLIGTTLMMTTTTTTTGAIAPNAGSATEQLVNRLLKPRVEPVEAKEYASWVDQFRHLSLAQELSDKDRALYKTHARLAGAPLTDGFDDGWFENGEWDIDVDDDEEDIPSEGGGGSGMVRLQVDQTNIKLYEEMIRCSRPGGTHLIGDHVGIGASSIEVG